MSDLPILNPELSVSAIGFQTWNEDVIGVLITPWFMNLVMISHSAEAWRGQRAGDKRAYRFAAGEFEFVFSREERLGEFMSCSLFSPVLEFEDQAAAEATAREVMKALFNEENREQFTPQEIGPDRDEGFDEGKSLTEEVLEGIATIGNATRNNLDHSISRRDLFRGRFLLPHSQIDNNSHE